MTNPTTERGRERQSLEFPVLGVSAVVFMGRGADPPHGESKQTDSKLWGGSKTEVRKLSL